jgi:hypothetical protein
MIERSALRQRIEQAIARYPVVALAGPRQVRDGFRLGVEIKRSDAPRLTPSMRNALHDLKLDLLWVIYPGTQSYTLHEKVIVMPLADIGTQRAQS